MTILGLNPQGKPVEISVYDRLTGMYVIGANGTGKSTLLEQLIMQDIEAGMGCCLLDPHGDLTNTVINRMPKERIDDVILLDPLDVDYPFGLNLFACEDTNDILAVEHAVSSIIGVYEKVFNMSVAETPRLSQYIRQVSYALVGSGYTMAEIPYLLLDSGFRNKLIGLDENLFWKTYKALRPTEQMDRSESTVDRIDSLLSNRIIRNIVGQSITTIDFRDIMDSGKILLVSLSARYESLTSLLGSIIIGQLLTAALSRAGNSKRRQFNLYADEYQRFATPDFATLLTEARKFGVATTIAHQVRSQLDEKNASTALQAGSLVCFRLTSEDAEELANEFNLDPAPAIKPSTTIPRNCLDYIDRHPNEKVKEFSAKYIHRLQEATRLKVKEDGAFAPMYDFGEGLVGFYKEDVLEALRILQTIFYDTMRAGKRTINTDFRFMKILSSLLDFEYLYKRLYLKDYTPIKMTEREHEERYGTDEEYTKLYDKLEKQWMQEYHRYMRFVDPFFEVLDILARDPIIATSTERVETTTQQTYSDRANQLANELVHLKRGHARVKLPNGEYLLITIVPETNKKDLQAKKQEIIDQTRKAYCKPRSEVEEEIKQRQDGDDSSPSITRKHPV